MSNFPSIAPSERSIKMGEPPIKLYRSLNGTVVRRSFGNKLANYQVELKFNGVSESKLAQFWDHYHDTRNLNNGFSLPDIVFKGYRTNAKIGRNEGFVDRINRMNSIEWYYAEPPSIESISTSFSNVSITLVGELRYSE